MTEVVNKNSADESEEKQRTLSLTENSPTGGIESEYDTASTNSRSDNEQDEYEDSENSADEEISDEEEEIEGDERESGDGQEELGSENGVKKKVDHDEDRSNPQYIPKKGTFYEHDDRTVEDLNADETEEASEPVDTNSTEGLSSVGKVGSSQNQKVVLKTTKKTKDTDRWSHDRFNENEQAPKSRAELVSAYGYDIRSEDGPPRPRRQRRYGRHQSKYSRNWEDEEAYKKSQSVKPPTSRRSLRAEDFPALGSTVKASNTKERSHKPSPRMRQDENDSKQYSSPERRREQRSTREDRDKAPRYSSEQRSQRYNNDTSNNNNSRHVKGKKNINFNHNIEFKNQNRKNINYETMPTKNNNVLNQQMQSGNIHNQSSSSSSAHMQQSQSQHSQSQSPYASSSMHHQQQQQHQQSNSRFNNANEAPMPTLSFTNSKMNNATNEASPSLPSSSSRGMLNYDNSSGNYGRANVSNREKDVNSQSMQQAQAMSPNKNIQHQYSERQMDQMKFMEKNYSQQQGKTTNLNLNQVQHQQLNNMPQDSSIASNSDMSRSKRYSSLRQRSNVGDSVATSAQQQQQQSSSQHFHQYQQEMEPPIVQMPPQQSQPYISQQTPTQASSNIISAPAQPQVSTNQQTPKYQAAAYYTTNPANEYALMQAAMVEKYQYQQQTTPTQYIPPPQQPAQPIYMPAQSQPSQQQQILNYVSTIQPQAAPAGAPAYQQYANYQNYNIQPPPAAQTTPQTQLQPPPVPAATQSTPQGIYQTQSGLTYYPNTQIASAHQQRILQPQRRPNPIPILAPPEKNKMKTSMSADDNEKGTDDKGNAEAENIDHILDNMFVQRPMPNVISLKDAAPPIQSLAEDDDHVNESMNNMSLGGGDDKKGEGGK